MKGINNRLITWLSSILIASLCWPIGLLVSTAFLPPTSGPEFSPGHLLILGGLSGLLIGLVQRVALGHRLAVGRFWELATVVGASAGFLAATLATAELGSGWWWLIGGAAGGALLGLAQAMAVKENWTARSGLVLAAVLSWASAYGFGYLTASGRGAGPAFTVGSVSAQVAVIGWAITAVIVLFLLIAISALARTDAARMRTRWW